MIYFDNAATGGFKIRAVTDAAETVIKFLSANPGRSGHRLSVTGAETVYSTRTVIAEHFSCSPDRVIFTKNCTEALNVAIFGSIKKGCHVISTVFEHNSVLRPLHHLKNSGVISLDLISPDDKGNFADNISAAIRPETELIVLTAISNVTGAVTDYESVCNLATAHGIRVLIDGAQGGGHVPLKVKEYGISYLALAGHKGLGGIMGSGILILNDDATLAPLILGGTGSESFSLSQPECYPERLESGTLNLPAIAALGEGVRFTMENLKSFSEHLVSYTTHLIDGLNKIPNVTVYSTPNPAGIVSFSVGGKESGEVADLLNSDYDVAVRGGLHCAPLMHKFLGTDECGLIRASLAVQNGTREINYFLRAVNTIAKN
ncbi:MAG: aminotransferase class V-fold PLP-dependent enzyme [Clostridia bacterium]|nr:aminotransferase class V-fold PLP-dependent enzyme [Clostridia bacterium]